MRRIALFLPLLLLPALASAQRVVGRVVEMGSEVPIANVEVRLDDEGTTVARVVTDSTGRFVLRARRAGRHHLSTNHIGYRRLDGDIELSQEDQIEVVLRLAVSATELPAIEVVARSRAPNAYLERTGFYDRMNGGFGVFRTPEDIEKRRAFSTSDYFLSTSGVRVIYSGIRGKDIRMTRGENPNCPPRVLIDNVVVRRGGRMSDAGDQPIDALLQPLDIVGIEIYRSAAETPRQYGGPDVPCGVVLFWTKRGAAR